MRRELSLAALAGVIGVAALFASLQIAARFAPGYTPVHMVVESMVTVKLAILVGVVCTIAGVVTALVNRRPGGRVVVLTLAAMVSVLGLAAAAYDWLVTDYARRQAGVDFAVAAPGYAEALFVLSLGAFGGALLLLLSARSPKRALEPAQDGPPARR